MQVLADAVLHTTDRIPGLALRTHHLDGRLKRSLQALLMLVGLACAAGAVVIGIAALRGYDNGTFGVVATIAIMAVGVWLLVGGAGCILRAARNPKVLLPDNVVPLHIVRSQAKPRADEAFLDEIPIAFGQLRDVD